MTSASSSSAAVASVQHVGVSNANCMNTVYAKELDAIVNLTCKPLLSEMEEYVKKCPAKLGNYNIQISNLTKANHIFRAVIDMLNSKTTLNHEQLKCFIEAQKTVQTNLNGTLHKLSQETTRRFNKLQPLTGSEILEQHDYITSVYTHSRNLRNFTSITNVVIEIISKSLGVVKASEANAKLYQDRAVIAAISTPSILKLRNLLIQVVQNFIDNVVGYTNYEEAARALSSPQPVERFWEKANYTLKSLVVKSQLTLGLTIDNKTMLLFQRAIHDAKTFINKVERNEVLLLRPDQLAKVIAGLPKMKEATTELEKIYVSMRNAAKAAAIAKCSAQQSAQNVYPSAGTFAASAPVAVASTASAAASAPVVVARTATAAASAPVAVASTAAAAAPRTMTQTSVASAAQANAPKPTMRVQTRPPLNVTQLTTEEAQKRNAALAAARQASLNVLASMKK